MANVYGCSERIEKGLYMKRLLLALDIQGSLETSDVIVSAVNKLATKMPTMATFLVKPETERAFEEDWLKWNAPNTDVSRVNTKYAYPRSGYALPAVILKAIEKNDIEEVLIVGAHTEAFLLSAGMQLFDLNVKVTMIAPLVLSGQSYQHTVTMKIWEASIGQVYENISEIDV